MRMNATPAISSGTSVSGQLPRHTKSDRLAIVRHPDAIALLVILGAGASLRFVFFLQAPVFVDGDSYQYYRPAYFLMVGEGFPLLLKQAPGYPAFVALVGRLLGGDLRNLIAVQALLGLATTALAYGVGRLTLGRGAAVVGGLAAALSSGLLIYEHYVMSETLLTFLLTLVVFLYVAGLRRGSWWCYAGAGLAIGLATLTRPHAQVLLAVGPLAAALYFRQWRPSLRSTVLVIVAAALLIAPWAVRNKVVHDTFSVADRLGHTLVGQTVFKHYGQYLLLDPSGPAEADEKRARARAIIQKVADQKVRDPGLDVAPIGVHRMLTNELNIGAAEADRLMRDVALEAIRRRPLTYVRLTFDDLRMIFTGTTNDLRRHWRSVRPGEERSRLTPLMRAATPEQERGFPLAEGIVNIYQSARLGLVVPLLFLVGLMSSLIRPGWRALQMPGFVVLSLHGLSAVVAGFGPRFHHPPDPLMHVVAFGGVLALCQLLAPRMRVLWRQRALITAESTENDEKSFKESLGSLRSEP